MNARQSQREVSDLRHLVAFARDLLQVHKVDDAMSLIGKTLRDIMQTDGGLLIANSDGIENAVAFGDAGRINMIDRTSIHYLCALHSLAGDSTVREAGAQGQSSIVIPFPGAGPIGSLLVYWNRTICAETLAYHALLLRHFAELIGAALGNLSLRCSLEQLIDSQFQQLEKVKDEHTSELARRDQVEGQMRSLSLTDVMTGLCNRRGFFLKAEKAYEGAKRHHAKSAVIFADVDNLKQVNDQQGHQAGDQLIRDCAGVFHDSFRAADIVARLGGDEFVAYTTYDENPEVILRRIHDKLVTFRCEGRPYKVSFSTGVVQCDTTADLSIADYLLMADRAMYAQKRGHGRE